MSDRIVMELMMRNVCEKIGEQRVCLEATTDPETKEMIQNRITQLEVERDMYMAMLNKRYYN